MALPVTGPPTPKGIIREDLFTLERRFADTTRPWTQSTKRMDLSFRFIGFFFFTRGVKKLFYDLKSILKETFIQVRKTNS